MTTTMFLPAMPGRGAELERRRHRGAGRDADRNAFELGDEARGVERGLVADGDDLVDDGAVEDVGHEAGADALDLVRPGLTARQDRRILGLDRDDLQGRAARLQHLADRRDGAAGADAGDEIVDLAVGVVPDLLGRGAAVDLGIGRVLELLRDDGAGDLGLQLLGLGDGALHALRAGREDELGAEEGQHLAALDRHGFRHDEDQAVAARGGHEGEGDAGIARGRLDQGAAGLEGAGRLQRVDHADADAVLDAGDRVEELELGQEIGLHAALAADAVEAHDGGVADGVGDGIVDPAAAGRPIRLGACQLAGCFSHVRAPMNSRGS